MKKTTLNALLLFSFGLISNVIIAQERKPFTPKDFKGCYSVENENFLRANNPKRMNTDQFEEWIAPKIAQIKADRVAGRNIQVVYNIPVVIHIVHNGDAIGTGENITDAQAISQINVMNQDFRRLVGTPGGANTTGLAVDCEINFCLAQTDPSGNLTTGVIRHNIAPPTNAYPDGAGGADWELRSDVETMKAATQWNPANYLNMWTIRPGGAALDAPTNPGLDGLLGYAQFPQGSTLTGITENTNASTDGVVAGFDVFGTNAENIGNFILNPDYNLGRTMTHEVGHWLGLRHIWGDNATCPASNSNANKDFCADTPAANAPNYTCNLTANSCATAGLDQVQNYMDYTNDACMDTFTAEQKLRMVTVMINSPRRSTLNASTACQTPTPLIKFDKPTGLINEGTNCNFTDYTYPVILGKAATQSTVVTFSANASSNATNTIDFAFVNPTVTFPTGSTAPQNLTLRVFNDGINEVPETLTIDLAVNANGGNAALNPLNSTITLYIKDNDTTPVNSQVITLINETLDGTLSPLNIFDLDGDANNWGLFTTNVFGFTGTALGSRSRLSSADPVNPNGPLTPDNLLLLNTALSIPVGSITNLKYRVGASSSVRPAEKYAVYVTTSNNSATIVAGAPTFEETLTVGAASSIKTISLAAFAGQTVYVSFRHYDCTDQAILLVDDIIVENTLITNVQTSVNTPTQYQAPINTTGTAYARDTPSSRAVADLTSTTNFDYGCVSVSVSRDQATAGAAAVNYGSNTAANLRVAAKTVTITPQNANTSGAGSLKFYFTEAEIAAWEAATGNLRSALRIIKAGNSAFTPTTLGAFGPTNVTLSGNFSNGIGGVYYFGVEGTLSTSNFEFNDDFKVYPNPTTDVLNIEINGGFDAKTSYVVYNNIGQVIKESKVNSANDLKINTSGLSNGIYFIKIEKSELTKTVKFIKE